MWHSHCYVLHPTLCPPQRFPLRLPLFFHLSIAHWPLSPSSICCRCVFSACWLHSCQRSFSMLKVWLKLKGAGVACKGVVLENMAKKMQRWDRQTMGGLMCQQNAKNKTKIMHEKWHTSFSIHLFSLFLFFCFSVALSLFFICNKHAKAHYPHTHTANLIAFGVCVCKWELLQICLEQWARMVKSKNNKTVLLY